MSEKTISLKKIVANNKNVFNPPNINNVFVYF